MLLCNLLGHIRNCYVMYLMVDTNTQPPAEYMEASVIISLKSLALTVSAIELTSWVVTVLKHKCYNL